MQQTWLSSNSRLKSKCRTSTPLLQESAITLSMASGWSQRADLRNGTKNITRT
jgi:hypothetical protein